MEDFETLKPSEKALAIAKAKNKLSKDVEVGLQFGVSDRTVRKFLKLLSLPESVRDQVDNGELSMNKALKGLSPSSAVKACYSRLSELGYLALEHLYVQRYVTIDQLARYLGESYRKSSEILADLKVAGYVDVEMAFRPYAYWLSHKGSTRLNHPPLKRWKSANALHQELMRNEIELTIREKNPSAKFLSRVAAMKLGYNPSNGEYLLSFLKNGEKALALVLIDDYHMPPSRVRDSLFRDHNPPESFYKGEIMRFSKDVEDVYVYVTDSSRRPYHSAFFKDNFEAFSRFNIQYRSITPIWKGLA